MTVDYAVVIPTIGRPSLQRLLRALADGMGPAPAEVVVVDDRSALTHSRLGHPPLEIPPADFPIRVVRSGGRGPAAARNVGWRTADAEWIAFLDDDVTTTPDWRLDLADDLADLPGTVGGSKGVISVPPPVGRAPTDVERNTATLATAQWITADMAFRRRVLLDVGGFDERFRRAYREDSDIALRITEAGHEIVSGARRTIHPMASGTFWTSARAQVGNADNALMRHKFGSRWRSKVGEGPGRLRRHALTTAAAAGALVATAGRQHRVARALAAAWVGLTAEFAYRRISPGPKDAAEITRMVATSAVIPPLACVHRVRGEVRVRRRWPAAPVSNTPAAILFDRDDTLIVDVPYLSDPDLVQPVPGAVDLLRELREAGFRIGVISNQSGVARGLITPEQLQAVNDRVRELLGTFHTWQICVHDDSAGCACRKPQPGMIKTAAAELGVDPAECVMIGDIGADVDAALAAGARAVLVPTAQTLPDEIAHAKKHALVAPELRSAVELALAGAR